MDENLTMSRAQLACIAVEAYLYGIYWVLAILTTWLLCARRARNRTTILLMVHTFIMFLVSTGHVVVILRYVYNIFLYHNAATEGDVIPSSGGNFIAFIMLLLLNCIIGDVVVIWRVWVIWGYNRKATIVPVLSWVASIAVLIGSCRILVRPEGLGPEDGLAVSPWIATFMGLTLLTNFAAVGAISYRFWLYRREVLTTLGSADCRISTVLILMIESGSLYCISWSVVLAAYLSNSRILDIVLWSSVAQLTAMYPTLIVVLVCLRATQMDDMDRLHLNSFAATPGNSSSTHTTHSSRVFGIIGKIRCSDRWRPAMETRVDELPSYTHHDSEALTPQCNDAKTTRASDDV